MKPDITKCGDAVAFRGRPRTGRNKKYYSHANASECIGELSKGCDIFGLTKGQFSLFDILEVILNFTGPADVVISTWTAAGADASRAKEVLDIGWIKTLRWIVDRSFLTRQPAYCKLLVERFGNDSIRTIRSHAKFMLIKSEEFSFVIRTSMNLNSNPRMEDFEISEDEDFHAYMMRFVDDVFRDFAPEENFGSHNLDRLQAFDASSSSISRGIQKKEEEPSMSIEELEALDCDELMLNFG